MPTTVSKIIALTRASLDAEGAEYYLDTVDFIPAINSAQNYIVTLINSQIGAKKFAEEHYRDLIKSLVFQTSIYSRIDLTPTSVPYKLWTILSLITNPTLNAPFTTINTIGGASAERGNFIYVSGGDPVARLTHEEWIQNITNPFAHGYDLEPNSLNPAYAYLNFTDYNFQQFNPNIPNEIEIRPHLSRSPVVVNFVKLPKEILTINDSVDFPESMTDLLVKTMLLEISFKQGDGTNISQLSSAEINNMLKAIL